MLSVVTCKTLKELPVSLHTAGYMKYKPKGQFIKMKILASFMQNNQLVSLSSILNLVLGKSYFKSCYIYIYI